MKKNLSRIQKSLKLFFLSLLMTYGSVNNINAVAPTLKIVEAAYGVLDENIRHGEYIALKNVGLQEWLEAKDEWFIITNKEFKPNQVFEIIKDNLEDGYPIKDGNQIRLKNISRKNYLGLQKKYHALLAKSVYTAHERKELKEDTSWSIYKFPKNGEVKDKNIIYLRSNFPEAFDQKKEEKRKILQRWGRTAGTDHAHQKYAVVIPSSRNGYSINI